MGESNRQKNKKNHNRVSAANAPFNSSMQHKSHITSSSKSKLTLKGFHMYLKTHGIGSASKKYPDDVGKHYREYLETL